MRAIPFNQHFELSKVFFLPNYNLFSSNIAFFIEQKLLIRWSVSADISNRSSRDLLEEDVWMDRNVKVLKTNESRFDGSVIKSVSQFLT